MTKSKAKKLKLGTPVLWDGDRSETGTVISIQPGGIGIRWEGVVTIIQVVFWKDINRVSLWTPQPLEKEIQMKPKINMIVVETGDPTTAPEPNNEYYPKVEICRGAHWGRDENNNLFYESGNSKNHYHVSVPSLIRSLRAVMVLEARNQPERAVVANMSRRNPAQKGQYHDRSHRSHLS